MEEGVHPRVAFSNASLAKVRILGTASSQSCSDQIEQWWNHGILWTIVFALLVVLVTLVLFVLLHSHTDIFRIRLLMDDMHERPQSFYKIRTLDMLRKVFWKSEEDEKLTSYIGADGATTVEFIFFCRKFCCVCALVSWLLWDPEDKYTPWMSLWHWWHSGKEIYQKWFPVMALAGHVLLAAAFLFFLEFECKRYSETWKWFNKRDRRVEDRKRMMDSSSQDAHDIARELVIAARTVIVFGIPVSIQTNVQFMKFFAGAFKEPFNEADIKAAYLCPDTSKMKKAMRRRWCVKREKQDLIVAEEFARNVCVLRKKEMEEPPTSEHQQKGTDTVWRKGLRMGFVTFKQKESQERALTGETLHRIQVLRAPRSSTLRWDHLPVGKPSNNIPIYASLFMASTLVATLMAGVLVLLESWSLGEIHPSIGGLLRTINAPDDMQTVCEKSQSGALNTFWEWFLKNTTSPAIIFTFLTAMASSFIANLVSATSQWRLASTDRGSTWFCYYYQLATLFLGMTLIPWASDVARERVLKLYNGYPITHWFLHGINHAGRFFVAWFLLKMVIAVPLRFLRFRAVMVSTGKYLGSVIRLLTGKAEMTTHGRLRRFQLRKAMMNGPLEIFHCLTCRRAHKRAKPIKLRHTDTMTNFVGTDNVAKFKSQFTELGRGHLRLRVGSEFIVSPRYFQILPDALISFHLVLSYILVNPWVVIAGSIYFLIDAAGVRFAFLLMYIQKYDEGARFFHDLATCAVFSFTVSLLILVSRVAEDPTLSENQKIVYAAIVFVMVAVVWYCRVYFHCKYLRCEVQPSGTSGLYADEDEKAPEEAPDNSDVEEPEQNPFQDPVLEEAERIHANVVVLPIGLVRGLAEKGVIMIGPWEFRSSHHQYHWALRWTSFSPAGAKRKPQQALEVPLLQDKTVNKSRWVANQYTSVVVLYARHSRSWNYKCEFEVYNDLAKAKDQTGYFLDIIGMMEPDSQLKHGPCLVLNCSAESYTSLHDVAQHWFNVTVGRNLDMAQSVGHIRRCYAVLSQLKKAVDQLHAHKWIHCSLKAEDVVLDVDSSQKSFSLKSLKLCNFSAAVRLGSIRPPTHCSPHMAPELSKASTDLEVAEAIDYWGIGHIAVHLLTGHWGQRHEDQEYWNKFSEIGSFTLEKRDDLTPSKLAKGFGQIKVPFDKGKTSGGRKFVKPEKTCMVKVFDANKRELPESFWDEWDDSSYPQDGTLDFPLTITHKSPRHVKLVNALGKLMDAEGLPENRKKYLDELLACFEDFAPHKNKRTFLQCLSRCFCGSSEEEERRIRATPKLVGLREANEPKSLNFHKASQHYDLPAIYRLEVNLASKVMDCVFAEIVNDPRINVLLIHQLRCKKKSVTVPGMGYKIRKGDVIYYTLGNATDRFADEVASNASAETHSHLRDDMYDEFVCEDKKEVFCQFDEFEFPEQAWRHPMDRMNFRSNFKIPLAFIARMRVDKDSQKPGLYENVCHFDVEPVHGCSEVLKGDRALVCRAFHTNGRRTAGWRSVLSDELLSDVFDLSKFRRKIQTDKRWNEIFDELWVKGSHSLAQKVGSEVG